MFYVFKLNFACLPVLPVQYVLALVLLVLDGGIKLLWK